MTHGTYATRRSITAHRLWAGKRPLLPHLDIELTERCNNACVHCYINRPAHDAEAMRRELTTEQWQGILRQAADLGALSVRLTGGEPLLRPDFAEIYLSARRLGMKVTLFTNGCLITPQLADLLARVPPRMKVELTAYGMHQDSYDAVTCRPSAYAEFKRGVDLLRERQIPFVVKSVLLPPNKAEIDEFEAWAATIPGMDLKPSYAVFLDLRTRRDAPDKNRRIAALRLSPEEGVALVARRGETYREGMIPFCKGFMGAHGDRLFSCGAGDTGCVDAYGAYQMCMMLRHPDTVYDLKHGTLREGLTEVFPRLREARASNPDYLRRCARCFIRGLCEQCPARSWTEHGTLDTPVEYLCQVGHAQAVYLGLLSEGERAWEVTDGPQRVQRLAGKSPQGG